MKERLLLRLGTSSPPCRVLRRSALHDFNPFYDMEIIYFIIYTNLFSNENSVGGIFRIIILCGHNVL